MGVSDKKPQAIGESIGLKPAPRHIPISEIVVTIYIFLYEEALKMMVLKKTVLSRLCNFFDRVVYSNENRKFKICSDEYLC